MKHCALLTFTFLFLSVGTNLAHAANPNRPHGHQGIIKPYDGAPPQVELTDAEKSTVASGTPVRKQIELAEGGRAVAVFKVNAPAKIIWSVLSDFHKYPEWIPSLKKSEVYKKTNDDKIFVEFKLSAGFFGSYVYYVDHNFPMEKAGYATWKLDYSRDSDLDDLVGFWQVSPVSGSPNECIITYSIEIKLKSWVPDFVRNMIVDGGLKEATQWVKEQSEKRAGR